MNTAQKALLAEIEKEKRRKQPDNKRLKKLVQELTEYDDREWWLRHSQRDDPGGRSRSPSMGKWKRDDEEMF